MSRPDHLFLSFDGCLYDTRDPDWSRKPALRDPFMRTASRIDTTQQLKATLRNGQTADGGYPLYFICQDGEAMSFDAVRAELKQCLRAFDASYSHNDWRVMACDVNWENPSLFCAHTNQRIESAYAEDEAAVDVAKAAFGISEDDA